MRRTLISTACLVIATAGMSSPALGQKSSTIEVATTIADLGAGSPYRVQSDGQGLYVTTVVNKKTQVKNILIVKAAGTDWSLTTYVYERGTYAATDRTVFFDLSEPAREGTFPPPPMGVGYRPAHLTAKCSDVGVDMTKMVQDATVECPGAMRFWAEDGLWYRFSFAPDNFDGVDRFAVTCMSATLARGVSSCTRWALRPGTTRTTGTDPNTKSLNRLLHIDSGGSILNPDGGDYYLSFSFVVSR
jgi:hypothetical protein